VTLYAQWVEGTADTAIKIENSVINSGSPLTNVTTSSTTAAIATAGVFTAAELAEIATGNIGYLWFVVSQGTADASAISNFLTEKGITDSGLTLDLTANIELWKRVGSGTDVQVTETSSPLTVVLSLSDSQIPSDPGKRTWYVVREHDGAYQLLNATYNATSKTLSFPCNAFSNFSVIYTSASSSERTTTSSTTTKSSGTTSSTTSTKTSSATPSTADNSVPQAAVAALFILGAGCTVLSIKRR
ncbi:MAG: hypothetical protein Q4B54_08015, partial [Coriobacteriales bacterium]|nr:hypothetical protein [Coriobacteriales bacterium]